MKGQGVMRMGAAVFMGLLLLGAMATTSQAQDTPPPDPRHRMHHPRPDDGVHQAVEAYKANPSEENKQELRRQLEIAHDERVARMEKHLEEMRNNKEMHINRMLERYTNPDRRPRVPQQQPGRPLQERAPQ